MSYNGKTTGESEAAGDWRAIYRTRVPSRPSSCCSCNLSQSLSAEQCICFLWPPASPPTSTNTYTLAYTQRVRTKRRYHGSPSSFTLEFKDFEGSFQGSFYDNYAHCERHSSTPLVVMQSLATFTFAICCHPSVCLSVTFVRPTQAVEIFDHISTALGTLAIHWHAPKILWRSSQGKPSVRELNPKGEVKYSDFGLIEGYISEMVQDRR